MRRPKTETTNTNTTPNARSALEAAEQVEATFRDFVQNALGDSEAPAPASGGRGAPAPRAASAPPSVPPRPPRPAREGSGTSRPPAPASSSAKVLPLLRKKKPGERPPRREITVRVEQPGGEPAKPASKRRVSDATPIPSTMPRSSKPPPLPPAPQRSEATVKRHAVEVKALVPDVAKVAPKPASPREAAEDGQIPALELDRFLAEMSTLLKYGHDAQVQIELDQVRHRYPRDLLLLRRLAELHLERRDHDRAIDLLFQLASGMFDRKNVEGMRATLAEVLKLDPENRRALRLLGLLKQR